jgi:hypothetical protein
MGTRALTPSPPSFDPQQLSRPAPLGLAALAADPPATSTIMAHPSRSAGGGATASTRRPHYPPAYAATCPPAPTAAPAAGALERAAAAGAGLAALAFGAAAAALGWVAAAAPPSRAAAAAAARLCALATLALPLPAAAAAAAALHSLLSGAEDHRLAPAAAAADNARIHFLVFCGLAGAPPAVRAASLALALWLFCFMAAPLALLAPTALRGLTTGLDAAIAAALLQAAGGDAGGDAPKGGGSVPAAPPLAARYWRLPPASGASAGAGLRPLFLAARADAIARGWDAAAARSWRPTPVSE